MCVSNSSWVYSILSHTFRLLESLEPVKTLVLFNALPIFTSEESESPSKKPLSLVFLWQRILTFKN